jgi:hypothetical protein
MDEVVLGSCPALQYYLKAGKVQQAVWHAHVLSANTPWGAVVIPDDVRLNAARSQERKRVTEREEPAILVRGGISF